MKFTYNWLKDFVEIKIPAKQLAQKLTMAGLEVTSLEEKDGDFVFEIEVTSNRPDWLSVVGIAREVAAITSKKLSRYPVIPLSRSTGNGQQANRLTIEIQDKKDCPLYTAKIIRDVKVGPSPEWLRKRLELIGCRSINNIVDITNYILFTWGEPLHAFDLDKIVSPLASYPVSPLEISVRRARKDEEIITIDGIRRMLNENILVITVGINRQTGKPIAIAGIMGGKDTEVIESTKNILLEAAVFNPIIVRRAQQKLGLESESSYRFERGIDLETAQGGSLEAVQMIEDLAGGKISLAKSAGLTKAKKKIVTLECASVEKILGVNISSVKIKKILSDLGLKVKQGTGGKFPIEIPSYRQDLNLEIDLIEEIARIYGYENIPSTLPAIKPQLIFEGTGSLPRPSSNAMFGFKEERGLVSLVKNILVGLGLDEVITLSLVEKGLLQRFNTGESRQAPEILNPLSREQEVLRSSILPSLVCCVGSNLNQKQEYISIFEVAKEFYTTDKGPEEELILGIALCGVESFLLEQGLIKEEVGFLHLKGIIETVLTRLGIKDYCFVSGSDPLIVDIQINKAKAGVMLKLERQARDSFEIKNKDVFLLELSLEQIFKDANLEKKFLPPPKYPAIARDISIILKEDISVVAVLGAVRETAGALLKEVRIADYYKGKQIPSGFRGLTITCLYRSDERTLTELEINPLHTSCCNLLKERFSAQIR